MYFIFYFVMIFKKCNWINYYFFNNIYVVILCMSVCVQYIQYMYYINFVCEI